MSVFGLYSKYYNLLYNEKNYQKEVQYINSIIMRYKPKAKSVLDLGCGTGKHAYLLAQMGYEVNGVDFSKDMLIEAKKLEKVNGLCFFEGDIRNIRINKTFDVVTALFHVMSYQTSNNDLYNAMLTAYEQLDNDGIFIFDCWYGPGVLTDRPQVRIKRLEDNEIQLTRLAEPTMYPNENLVSVNYHILFREKPTCIVEELKETHLVRYLFMPEVDYLFKNIGFKMESCMEYLTEKDCSYDTWYACFVGRKI